MNINYSKMYSTQLDIVYNISISSSWGLNEIKWMEIEDSKRKWIRRISEISLWSWKDIFDQEGSSIEARIEICNQQFSCIRN